MFVYFSVLVFGGGLFRWGWFFFWWWLCGYFGFVLVVGGFEFVEFVEEV